MVIMGKTKRRILGTVRFDPEDITKSRGHDYGTGRAPKVHKHPGKRREKQRLQKELRGY